MPTGATAPTWPGLLVALLARRDLTTDETRWAMGQVMAGEANPIQLAGFLVALRAKGETVAEVGGLVDEMLAHAHRISVPGATLDIVGTGGDLHRTVNISTTAAFVAAGAGARVVKHGGRAVSSASGNVDVLEALGGRVDLPPARVAEIAEEAGITFCPAPVFHPAMRHAGPVRKGLAVPTAFNVLGPLTNPAQPAASAIGVPDVRLAALMAGVLAGRGREALVFRGHEGLDELAATGPAQVWWVRDGAVTEHELDPVRDLGLDAVTVDDLRGGDAASNARVARDVLSGRATEAVRQTVLLNAAAGLAVHASATGAGEGSLVDRLSTGLAAAAAAVDDGRAAEALERWVAACGRG
ncbi:MAG TPA: anthranilate phosphoribosyltransferase [Actinomycetospora sp.]|nr:anthranilate phosphoribosyltransferase [Actinomycetospora sp.]